MSSSTRPLALCLPLLLVLALGTLVLRGGAQVPSRPTPSNASADAIRANNLGVASMSQQKFEQALEHFEHAAAADPAFPTARLNQAIALINLQRYDEARALLTALAEQDPQNARAWYNLGLLQRSTGEADAALAAFQKTAVLRPQDAHSHYFVGLMAAQLQKYDDAIAAFTRTLEVDPFLASAEFGLARAYQRAGNTAESRKHLERFQRLTTEKIASAMTLAYGDQGPFSLAEAVMPADAPAPPAIPVTFSLQPIVRHDPSGPSGSAGPGGCLFDFDSDGSLDYLALGPDGARLLRNTGGGTLSEHARLVPKSRTVACTTGDYDNDERPDIAISTDKEVVLFHSETDGTFAPQDEKVLPPGAGTPLGLAFVDYDHDADLDLIVARTSRPGAAERTRRGDEPAAARTTLWRNNGDGTFVDVAAERGLAGDGRDVAVTASDLNNDRAIDLVITGDATRVFLNPREGAFKAAQPWSEAMPGPTQGVLVLDFDKDGWMDLAFTHRAPASVSLWRNRNGTSFERVPLPLAGIQAGTGLAAFDHDNDGWIDLAIAGVDESGQGVAVLRNVVGTYEDVSTAVRTAGLDFQSPRALMAGDLDGDADSDLVVTSASGEASLLRNDGGNKHNAVRITLKGLNDNRSGVGTKVEVQAGTVWQKFETYAASGYLGQSSPQVLAGIGAAKEADVVRLLWPTGVVQDEVQLAAGAHTIEQIDRRGSSCPILFTWNGSEYEFITDAIGPAVVGHWVAPGERNVPDPDEYIRIDGRQLQARDGRLSLKFMEPMEEVIYLDEVRLIAVDHPAGTDVHPNEYFAAIAPQPAPLVFGVKDARLPAGAWDERGRDVSAALNERDGRYVTGFEDAPFKGFAKLHALELDLGPRPAGAPLRLIMSGFTDYFTATSVFAAHQANVTAVVPYLEVQTRDGAWQRVSDDIGFPAGLRRTMTADLTGKLPDGARRVRIWTNLKVYWDQILVDTTPAGAVPMERREAPLVSAELDFRGFPREQTGTPAADLTYVYREVSRFGPWARHRGFYTRYGDVTPLLGTADDRFAIFGAGEETSLEFDATALPPLPQGWTRDYLFYVRGYVKDMDFYAAHAQTVAPLPFSDMGRYPYLEKVRYPAKNHEYLLEWNTRIVDSESWPSYRLDYRRR